MSGNGYIPTGILIRAGFSKPELCAWLETARAELMAGRGKVEEWSSGSESAKRVFSGNALSTIEAIEEIYHALATLDPQNYGQNLTPKVTRATFF